MGTDIGVQPGPGEIFLDHVGWFVPDLDLAASVFGKLGFPLTPYIVHQNADSDGSQKPSGTANRCAMLERGYLEILTDVQGLDTPLTRAHRAALARYTGLHLIAFATGDLENEAARLSRDGFSTQPVVNLRRPAPLDDGTEGEAAFSVLRVPPGAMEEGRIQFLTHLSPETVWQNSMVAKDNGITGLTGVVICVRDPEAAGGRYARFTGRPYASGRIELDRGRLEFVDPDGLGRMLPGAVPPDLPFIAAAILESADLARTCSALSAAGVTIHEPAVDTIAVGPADAMGAWVVIEAA